MKRRSALTAPFLKRVSVVPERIDPDVFPFDRLGFLNDPDFALSFPTRVTFFVGENGSGKSTVLEALAELCGFPVAGGSQDHRRPGDDAAGASRLADALRPEWLPRVRSGFFLRAESFFDFAGYIDAVGDPAGSGGRALQAQSHGESVLSVLSHRVRGLEQAILLMDEPEAALSPSRQLAFLSLLHAWERSERVQVVVATHSPLLLCYPGATLYQVDADGIAETAVEQTEHYRVTRAFLANPDRYLAELFDEGKAGDA